jgi:hypothetical protein
LELAGAQTTVAPKSHVRNRQFMFVEVTT